MTRHHRFNEAYKLVEADIAVLFTGEAGSGKTTLAEQIAEEFDNGFHSISMTRQTTLSHMLGFMSVNGTYVESAIRRACEFGGVMLLDEIDAGDPNCMLCLNTIENGYISFPDKVVKCHTNFRLIATANPQDQHNFYTGRSKLDAATLDRFDNISVDRDNNLETSLVDVDTHKRMQLLRSVLKKHNSSKFISMRDAIRYQQRKDLGVLTDDFVHALTGRDDLVLEKYNELLTNLPAYEDQGDCQNIDDLLKLLKQRAGEYTSAEAKAEDGKESSGSDQASWEYERDPIPSDED